MCCHACPERCMQERKMQMKMQNSRTMQNEQCKIQEQLTSLWSTSSPWAARSQRRVSLIVCIPYCMQLCLLWLLNCCCCCFWMMLIEQCLLACFCSEQYQFVLVVLVLLKWCLYIFYLHSYSNCFFARGVRKWSEFKYLNLFISYSNWVSLIV